MRQRVILAITCLLPLTSAVALIDFTPRNTNLPDNCNRVYIQQIPGCVDADFTGMGTSNKAKCSQACVDGLVTIQGLVQKACGGLALDGQSLVGRFLKGDVIPELCPNFKVTTVLPEPPSSTQPPPKSTPPPASSTANQPSPSSIAFSSPDPSSSSPTAASSSNPSSTQSESPLATDTNPPPRPTATSIIVPNPAPSDNNNQGGLPTQLSNIGSGGGSPFDVTAGTGAASSLTINPFVALLAPAAAGIAMLTYI